MNFQRFSTQKRGFLSLAFWQFWPIALLIFTMVCPFVSPFYFTLFFLTPLLMHVSTNLKNLLMNSCIYFSKIVTMKIFTSSTGTVWCIWLVNGSSNSSKFSCWLFVKSKGNFPCWTKSFPFLLQSSSSSFLLCPLFPLTIHERVLLVLKEHFWNSACGEWLQGVDRDRRVRVGLFNLNSNWRRKVVAVVVVVVDPLFSRRRIRNSICFYDFSCSAPPMHYPTLDVKSHLRKEVSSPQSALLFCCLKAHSSKVWLLC